jgi:urea transport system substrate-binding protein
VVPTAWLAISEPQLGLFRAAGILGDYSAGCYFEGLDTPANRAFVGRFRKQFGPTRRINDTMQTAYAGVHLWKKAVEKAGSTDTAAVRQALRGMSIEAPDGPMKIDGGNLHAWRTARVGKVVSDEGRLGFQIVHQTPGPVAPEPFPDWRTKEQWQEFLHKLYIGWGNAWEKHK